MKRKKINGILPGISIIDFLDKDIQRFIVIKIHMFNKVNGKLSIL